MRSLLAGAFSEQSVAEQECLVAVLVDRFIQVLGVRGSEPSGVDITETLKSLTFDITGDLAFGESFGALEKGPLVHPRVLFPKANFPQLNSILGFRFLLLPCRKGNSLTF
jgi:cytochrome P450